MEKYLQDILKELKSLNTKVDTLEQGQGTITDEIKMVKGDVQTLKSDVQTLKGDVQTLATEMHDGFREVNIKLDTLYAQVAHNTEQEVRLDDVLTRVELLENDNKLLKKAIANL